MNIVVLVIFNKSCVLLNNEAQLDFQEGPGRAPKRVFGALARSQGALGTRVQVHGACLGGRLDRQEFARAQLLREIPSVFLTIPFFALNDFWKVPRRSWKHVRGPRRRPRGAKNDRSIFWGAPGGPKSEHDLEQLFLGKFGTSRIATLLGTEAKSEKT